MASQKWKTFENVIAKELSKWLFGEEKALRRTPCSGGWKGRGTGADIAVPDDRADIREFDMFAYEAKCRGGANLGSTGWHFEQFLTSPKHQILEWWHTLSESALVRGSNKLRMLIFSKTSGVAKAYVALGEREMSFFRDAGTAIDYVPQVIFKLARCEDPSFSSETLHFFRFLSLLESVDAGKLKTFWQHRTVSEETSDGQGK